MNRYTRGEFLGIGAALATGFGVGDFELRGSDARLARARSRAPLQEAGDVTPDLILVGGRVYTVDGDLPQAEAFAVKNSRFIAVGSSDDIRNLAGPGTEVIDAGGMTVTPGFIDAHLHPASGGVRELTEVNLDVRGITAETESPPGGHIYLDDGELNGLLAENANDLFQGLLPSGSTREERQAGVKLISELVTAAGLTSLHDTGCSTDYAIAYQDAYKAGELRCRIAMYSLSDMTAGLKAAGIHSGLGDEWVRVGGVKYTADGSASGRTMAMSTPFIGRPDDYGILTMTQEEIHEVVEDAHRHDLQIGIHCNGDVAIDMVLNAYERVQRMWPRPDPRHRLEHCTLVNPSLLARIRDTGSVPTPFWTYVYYHGNKWVEYGEEKMRFMFAHRSFLDYDIPVAGASDYVPGPYEPMMALQSMVTRTDSEGRVWGPNQRVTVSEALRIATINGARASHEEHLKGSITPGKLADFVILAEDPHETDPEAFQEIGIVRTVVGGRTMHLA